MTDDTIMTTVNMNLRKIFWTIIGSLHKYFNLRFSSFNDRRMLKSKQCERKRS
jgi:hypothetical protein